MICRIIQLLSVNKLYLPELFYAKNKGLLWPKRFYAYLKLSIMRKFVLNAHPHIFNSLLPQILSFRFFQKGMLRFHRVLCLWVQKIGNRQRALRPTNKYVRYLEITLWNRNCTYNNPLNYNRKVAAEAIIRITYLFMN